MVKKARPPRRGPKILPPLYGHLLSLWYGAIWIPWKSASRPRVSQQSAATRRPDSSADGCYSYGLDGNIWIPGGRPFMALFLWRMAECLSSCHPAGLPRSGARFNVWGLRLGENGHPIRGMELDFWPRARCLRPPDSWMGYLWQEMRVESLKIQGTRLSRVEKLEFLIPASR